MESLINLVATANNTSTPREKTESETAIVKKLILGHLWETCYRAHSNTSFSPERRANSYVRDYSEMLEKDLLELGDNCGNYKEKFISKFSLWMSAKGRCISSMITGPSNFPVRRANKANNAERNHCDNFYKWREGYFKAVNRIPWKSPEDELELAVRKYERLANNQIEMKEINAAIRKSKLTDLRELIDHLVGLGYNINLIKLMDSYHAKQTGKYKIPSFVLSNNNAVIKNTEKKIKIMETRIDIKNNWEDIIFEGGRVTIEDDRLKIIHDEKPSREIINEIKSNGYRWSPHWSAWCRKHTGNAIYSLRFISFIKPHLNNA